MGRRTTDLRPQSDNTDPSDPRVVYVGKDVKLRYARDEGTREDAVAA
jgi:hypothetical protein